jgi:hypothetical protein
MALVVVFPSCGFRPLILMLMQSGFNCLTLHNLLNHIAAFVSNFRQQAKLNNNYKNTKLKLKFNFSLVFLLISVNKMCKVKQLKPNHINIKINGQKPQDMKNTTNAIRFKMPVAMQF